jgi:hypothetical protein
MQFDVNKFVEEYEDRIRTSFAEKREIELALERQRTSAHRAAQDLYEEESVAARKKRDAAYEEAGEAVAAGYAEAEAAHRERTKTPIGELLSGMGGEDASAEDAAKLAETAVVVQWMVSTECWNEYRGECEIFLRDMPRSMDQVKSLKNVTGWCEVYDDLVVKALKAGVVPGVTPLEAATYVVERTLVRNEYRLGSETAREIKEAFDLIMTFIPEAAVEAEAPAGK